MNNELGSLPLDTKDILLDRALGELPGAAFKAYFYLIFEQWQGGPLPLSLPALAQLARCTPTIFKRKVWPEVQEYFEKTSINGEEKLIEPVSYARRIEAVKRLVKRQALAEKQRLAWAQKNSPGSERIESRGESS